MKTTGLTRKEAQAAFVAGEKISHDKWDGHEYLCLNDDASGVDQAGGIDSTGVKILFGGDSEYYTDWSIVRTPLTRAEIWDLLGRGGEVIADDGGVVYRMTECRLRVRGESEPCFREPQTSILEDDFSWYEHKPAGTHKGFLDEQ